MRFQIPMCEGARIIKFLWGWGVVVEAHAFMVSTVRSGLAIGWICFLVSHFEITSFIKLTNNIPHDRPMNPLWFNTLDCQLCNILDIFHHVCIQCHDTRVYYSFNIGHFKWLSHLHIGIHMSTLGLIWINLMVKHIMPIWPYCELKTSCKYPPPLEGRVHIRGRL